MKIIVRFLWILALIPLLSGCEDKVIRTELLYEPVYISFADLRTPIVASSPDTLQKPGKIYVKGEIIFINEYLKGIHVINNSDPEHPQPIAFIEVPGNTEMAVRNNILYVNNYVDLVALDITDPAHTHEAGRLKDVFPYVLPPNDGKYEVDWQSVDQSKGIVVGWEAKKVSRRVDVRIVPYPIYMNYVDLKMYSEASPTYLFNGGDGGVSMGIGGSMARYTVYDSWLYALAGNSLKIIKVSDPNGMCEENEIWIRSGAETIFRHEDKLFFGTTTGMLIYDLTDPVNPGFVSKYDHILSCDPVVVQGDYAYVTLHVANGCGSNVNRLDVIDISDIAQPVLKSSYPFTNPHGLAIRETLLFVCDGINGLKVMNATDPLHMTPVITFPGIHAYDVIPLSSSLLMIGDDGLYQYAVDGASGIRLLSSIPVSGD